jgi:hypothetical protein
MEAGGGLAPVTRSGGAGVAGQAGGGWFPLLPGQASPVRLRPATGQASPVRPAPRESLTDKPGRAPGHHLADSPPLRTG